MLIIVRSLIALITGLAAHISLSAQAFDPLKPYDGPTKSGVSTTGLTGKVMTGYQGWFNCPGDGAGLGWTHWALNRNRLLGPGNVTVDLWPDSPLDLIPRLEGRFLWSQFVEAKRSGAQMVYVAMFDEVDEATAIFKCTNHPPVGSDVAFLTYKGLPSDHYLWLTGEGGRLLRNEIPLSNTFPIRNP